MADFALFMDETNVGRDDGNRFFIYGGLAIPAERLGELHLSIGALRSKWKFSATDSLKFDTNTAPKGLGPDGHRQVKDEVLNLCLRLDARFIASLVLHEIAKKKDDPTLLAMGANSVLFGFHRMLQVENATGLCIADRQSGKNHFDYLKERFQVGLEFDGGPFHLDRIHTFAASCIGASHAISAIDIVLGAFRFCVNERIKTAPAEAMFPKLASLLWARKEGNVRHLRDYGLILRPKEIQVAAYQAEYDKLVAHLQGLLPKPDATEGAAPA